MTKQNRLCLSGSRTVFYLRPLWRAQIMASVPSAKLSLLKFAAAAGTHRLLHEPQPSIVHHVVPVLATGVT